MLSLFLLAAAIAFGPDDAALAYASADELVREHSPRHAGTIRGRLAAGWILDRVSRTGVDATLDAFQAETPDGVKPFQNVMVEFAGTKTNAPWIVVMSHYDTAPLAGPNFQGANDGASTSALLIALAGAIRRAGPPADNIALVWTDGEECRREYGPHDGFQGSERLVAHFRERKRNVKCAICLDMLGDRNLNIIIPGNGERALRRIALHAARRAGEGDRVALADDLVVKDDHEAFLKAGHAAVCLIDFEYGEKPGGNEYWHTAEDTMKHVSRDSLLASGKIAAKLLTLLQTR